MFNPDTAFIESVSAIPGVTACFPVIQETAMAKFRGEMRPVTIKGVSENYIKATLLDEKIIGGTAVFSDTSSHPLLIAGYGVATALHLEFRHDTPILLYYPNRKSRTASLSSLITIESGLAGVFSYGQEQDNEIIYADINTARTLIGAGNAVSKAEIFVDSEKKIGKVKEAVSTIAGEEFRVIDKFEENSSFYTMMKIEKLLVFLIMLFILLIASFNIVASISMLLIDKKENLFIYRSMGMTRKDLIRIFETEGWFIVAAGAVSGLLTGCIICLIQEKFGIITLGNGNYIVGAYPVKLLAADIAAVLATVMAIGYATTTLPVRYLIKKWI